MKEIIVNEFSDREPHDFFGYTATLNIDERNDLDDYLKGLAEFREWDEAGFVLGLKQKLLKASAAKGATAGSINEACDQARLDFRKYKELGESLRRKVKGWCRAMADDPA
jgi:hypothetical protein